MFEAQGSFYYTVQPTSAVQQRGCRQIFSECSFCMHNCKAPRPHTHVQTRLTPHYKASTTFPVFKKPFRVKRLHEEPGNRYILTPQLKTALPSVQKGNYNYFDGFAKFPKQLVQYFQMKVGTKATHKMSFF